MFEAALSKTQQVTEALRREIVQGLVAPGSRLANVRELAGRFAVSRTVVLSAFDALESEGFITREPRRGIFVAETQTATFGLLTSYLPAELEPYFKDLDTALGEAGAIQVQIAFERDEARLALGLQAIASLRARAVLVDLSGDQGDIRRIRSMAQGLRVVACNRWFWDQPPQGPAVLTDHADLIRQAAAHFLGRGRHEIVWLAILEWQVPLLTRLLKQALAALGEPFDPARHRIVAMQSLEDEPQRLRAVLPGASAVFGWTDYTLWRFLTLLRARAPGAGPLECCGVNATPWSMQPGRAFHSFRIPYLEIWRRALARSAERDTAVEFIKPQLLLREQGPGLLVE
ncbi:MAG: GntR family transcriptional regulator [Planctomycetota bacterium]|nr:GntR family transcriptional regulator [Planctomycetota bacterium]